MQTHASIIRDDSGDLEARARGHEVGRTAHITDVTPDDNRGGAGVRAVRALMDSLRGRVDTVECRLHGDRYRALREALQERLGFLRGARGTLAYTYPAAAAAPVGQKGAAAVADPVERLAILWGVFARRALPGAAAWAAVPAMLRGNSRRMAALLVETTPAAELAAHAPPDMVAALTWQLRRRGAYYSAAALPAVYARMLEDALRRMLETYQPPQYSDVRLLRSRYARGHRVHHDDGGATYRGLDLEEGQLVTLKVLEPVGAGELPSREHAMQALAAYNVSDVPGVVATRDAFRDGAALYVVLEYLQYGTLEAEIFRRRAEVRRELASGREGAVREHLAWCTETAAAVHGALAAMHRRGIVHGNLHPRTVGLRLSRRTGRLEPVLADVGAGAAALPADVAARGPDTAPTPALFHAGRGGGGGRAQLLAPPGMVAWLDRVLGAPAEDPRRFFTVGYSPRDFLSAESGDVRAWERKDLFGLGALLMDMLLAPFETQRSTTLPGGRLGGMFVELTAPRAARRVDAAVHEVLFPRAVRTAVAALLYPRRGITTPKVQAIVAAAAASRPSDGAVGEWAACVRAAKTPAEWWAFRKGPGAAPPRLRDLLAAWEAAAIGARPSDTPTSRLLRAADDALQKVDPEGPFVAEDVGTLRRILDRARGLLETGKVEVTYAINRALSTTLPPGFRAKNVSYSRSGDPIIGPRVIAFAADVAEAKDPCVPADVLDFYARGAVAAYRAAFVPDQEEPAAFLRYAFGDYARLGRSPVLGALFFGALGLDVRGVTPIRPRGSGTHDNLLVFTEPAGRGDAWGKSYRRVATGGAGHKASDASNFAYKFARLHQTWRSLARFYPVLLRLRPARGRGFKETLVLLEKARVTDVADYAPLAEAGARQEQLLKTFKSRFGGLFSLLNHETKWKRARQDGGHVVAVQSSGMDIVSVTGKEWPAIRNAFRVFSELDLDADAASRVDLEAPPAERKKQEEAAQKRLRAIRAETDLMALRERGAAAFAPWSALPMGDRPAMDEEDRGLVAERRRLDGLHYVMFLNGIIQQFDVNQTFYPRVEALVASIRAAGPPEGRVFIRHDQFYPDDLARFMPFCTLSNWLNDTTARGGARPTDVGRATSLIPVFFVVSLCSAPSATRRPRELALFFIPNNVSEQTHIHESVRDPAGEKLYDVEAFKKYCVLWRPTSDVQVMRFIIDRAVRFGCVRLPTEAEKEEEGEE